MKQSILGLVAIGALIAGPAVAADLRMPVKAPPAPLPPPFSWTGCYIGVEGGGAFGRTDAISNGTVNGVPDGTAGLVKVPTHDISGGLVGGTLGCNYQFTNWVIGIEGDGSWANITGSSALGPAFASAFTEDVKQDSFFTLRGRLGYAWDRVLFYATGGGAWTDAQIHEFNNVAVHIPGVCGGVLVAAGACSATESHMLNGWTVGGGIEYAFLPNWSIKVEYLHADFGRTTFFSSTGTACCTSEGRHLTDEIVRAGLNWHFNFGGGPVGAPY